MWNLLFEEIKFDLLMNNWTRTPILLEVCNYKIYFVNWYNSSCDLITQKRNIFIDYFWPASVSPYHVNSWVMVFQYQNKGYRETKLRPLIIMIYYLVSWFSYPLLYPSPQPPPCLLPPPPPLLPPDPLPTSPTNF